jgi:hypothetical protein
MLPQTSRKYAPLGFLGEAITHTDELRHALAVKLGTGALDTRNIPYVKNMVFSCADLATVNQRNNMIRLVHYTTQVYFKRTSLEHFPEA